MLAIAPSPCLLSDVGVEQHQFSGFFVKDEDVCLEHADRIRALKQQEDTRYHYETYLRRSMTRHRAEIADDSILPTFDSELRGQICAWNYRVVDHFDLTRDLVAISLSFFDRCLATCGNCCSAEVAW